MSQAWEKEVAVLCRQYLQLEPSLTFPDRTILRLPQVQQAIFTNLFADGAVQYGPPMRYKAKTLKDLVSRIEASIDDWDQHELDENLMSALSVLLVTPMQSEAESVQQKCYVTYHLSGLTNADDANITLLENRSLLAAGGTTGLRTWEAALHLGQFLSWNKSMVSGKRVLELGAGTGFLSILCARHLNATHAIASDASDDVINNLPENIFLNGLQASKLVTPMDLTWGHALVGTEEGAWNGGRPVDVVLGADVTYDVNVIPALVATLFELFTLHPHVEAYISATQRNEVTLSAFLATCEKRGMSVEEVNFKVPARQEQEGPFYNDQVPIRICRVTPKQ